MLDIEAKTKLKASEGAHFFFTLIFLIITGNKNSKNLNNNNFNFKFKKVLFNTNIVMKYAALTLDY